jgi:hypothetical protein
VNRSDIRQIGLAALVVVAAALEHYLDVTQVATFLIAAAAIALLARLADGARVGGAA